MLHKLFLFPMDSWNGRLSRCPEAYFRIYLVFPSQICMQWVEREPFITLMVSNGKNSLFRQINFCTQFAVPVTDLFILLILTVLYGRVAMSNGHKLRMVE